MAPQTAELTRGRVVVFTRERLPAARPGLSSPHLDDPGGFRMEARDPIPAVPAEVHTATAVCHIALEAGAHHRRPVLRMAARDHTTIARKQSLTLHVKILIGEDVVGEA